MDSNFITSWIRTTVPAMIGAFIFWLNNLVGIDVDSEGLAAALTALAISVYYGVVRLAEARWPIAGIALGAKSTPSYEE